MGIAARQPSVPVGSKYWAELEVVPSTRVTVGHLGAVSADAVSRTSPSQDKRTLVAVNNLSISSSLTDDVDVLSGQRDRGRFGDHFHPIGCP